MAADRWGWSWGGDGGSWGISWSLGNSPVATYPAYGAPFITVMSEMTTTLSKRSEITPFISRRSEIDEDA